MVSLLGSAFLLVNRSNESPLSSVGLIGVDPAGGGSDIYLLNRRSKSCLNTTPTP